ncbi:MAG TPA: protein-L-isoaspartate(D-aspartate) O-methyltransferase [Phycisphaerales bacterium]|nr:protein-L-isoaspartate(D-aspartate) O-methyltransferase [Phycisphaerales bacterium]
MILGMTGKDVFLNERRTMLEVHLRGRGVVDPRVLRAMEEVPREVFVPPEYRHQAYADGPLPIGMGQTISQPYIVALMTQELRADGTCDVLEIGTGCGYQTAVLCRLARRVYTMERIAELSAVARENLGRLGAANVEFRMGDGSAGWPGRRTFERIMVTAALPSLPRAMTEQLVEGGLIVAPVGGGSMQELIVAEKRRGRMVERHLCGCRFVKLIGEYGFSQ